MKKLFLVFLLAIGFSFENAAHATHFSRIIYNSLSNYITEKLWHENGPDPESFRLFLEQVSLRQVEVEGLKEGTLDEIIEHYRAIMHKTYFNPLEPRRIVPQLNSILSKNVDQFLDDAKRIAVTHQFPNEVVSKALFFLADGNFILF
jgi:hypothetical protein